MKKTGIVSIALAMLTAINLAFVGVSASGVNTYTSVTAFSEGQNMFIGGELDKAEDAANWKAGGQKMRVVETDNGGYLECSGISVNYTGFTY